MMQNLNINIVSTLQLTFFISSGITNVWFSFRFGIWKLENWDFHSVFVSSIRNDFTEEHFDSRCETVCNLNDQWRENRDFRCEEKVRAAQPQPVCINKPRSSSSSSSSSFGETEKGTLWSYSINKQHANAEACGSLVPCRNTITIRFHRKFRWIGWIFFCCSHFCCGTIVHFSTTSVCYWIHHHYGFRSAVCSHLFKHFAFCPFRQRTHHPTHPSRIVFILFWLR